MELYGIYGANGFGREVMPLAVQNYPNARLVFIDDNPTNHLINGHEVMSFEQFCNDDANKKKISIAIANYEVRQKLSEKILKNKISLLDIKAKNSIILDQVEIKEGSILCPFTTITSNVKIGRHFHANLYSYVAHDCIIGDFVTFAPAVKCNGNVIIENNVYIGTGAIIKQGSPQKPLIIEEGAVIGAGSFVTKNVKAGETVFGSPAKPLRLLKRSK